MSLMLRKACQDLLDNFLLQQYHVNINADSKHLEIVGECGQTLLSIAGIKFNRLQPTKDEINYATELLDAFLTKHVSEISKFITANNEFKKLDVVERSLKAQGIYCTVDEAFHYKYENLPRNNHTVKWKDGPYIIEENIDTKVIRFAHDSEKYDSINFADLCKFMPNSASRDKAVKHYKAYEKYIIKRKEVEELRQALQTCEI